MPLINQPNLTTDLSQLTNNPYVNLSKSATITTQLELLWDYGGGFVQAQNAVFSITSVGNENAFPFLYSPDDISVRSQLESPPASTQLSSLTALNGIGLVMAENPSRVITLESIQLISSSPYDSIYVSPSSKSIWQEHNTIFYPHGHLLNVGGYYELNQPRLLQDRPVDVNPADANLGFDYYFGGIAVAPLQRGNCNFTIAHQYTIAELKE